MPSLSKFCCLKNILNFNRLRYFHNGNFNRLDPSAKYLLRNVESIKRNYLPVRERYSHQQQKRAKSIFYYLISLAIAISGAGFAAVPLFNAYCQVTNYAGTVNIEYTREKTKNLFRVPERELTILFNADKSSMLQWNFQPLQGEVKVVPGETVLAFYSAQNPTDHPISGISTYNVAPYEAGQYFNKIQCFCFDEQQLNPHEQVDMPVFFYIDPDIVKDPYMQNVDTITLSYTFFEALEGLDLPFLDKQTL